MSWLSRSIKEIIVYRSVSSSVWENLAFEDWILQNVDLSFRRILFLWQNSPCNPWLETNVPLLRARGVELARRRSGGGAVYHDLGNLNCTVFTHTEDYSRPRNLWLVCDALNERWPSLELSVTKRDDILCKDHWKVSGSSAKLTKDSAYHHFTLLLEADRSSLRQLLQPHPQLQFAHSNSTPSQRSKVTILQQEAPSVTLDHVCSAIVEKFYDVHRVIHGRRVIDINPSSESQFPGITRMQKELKSWEWNYGKSPKFTVTAEQLFSFGKATLTLEVVRGFIHKCDVELRGADHHPQLKVKAILTETLTGLRFWGSDISMATKTLLVNNKKLTEMISWIVHLS